MIVDEPPKIIPQFISDWRCTEGNVCVQVKNAYPKNQGSGFANEEPTKIFYFHTLYYTPLFKGTNTM